MAEGGRRLSVNFKEKLMQIVRDKILAVPSFEECFKDVTLSKTKLQKLQVSINKSVLDAYDKEVENVLKDAKVDEKFSILDSLEPVEGLDWRPPNDPNVHMRSIRCHLMLKKIQETEVLIKIKTNRIERLKNDLKNFHDKCDNIKIKSEKMKKLTVEIENFLNRNDFQEVNDTIEKALDLLGSSVDNFHNLKLN